MSSDKYDRYISLSEMHKMKMNPHLISSCVSLILKEKKKLNEKAKAMANAYSWIVYYKRSISDKAMMQCHSYMQFKSKILANQKHDEFFYESVLLFSVKALKDAFEPS